MSKNEIVTTDGQTVRLRPVSQLLLQRIRGAVEAELRAQGLPLDVPTYTVQTAGGGSETHTHDEKSLTTAEDRAAWAAYQAATAKLEQLSNERTTRVLLLKGIECREVPEAWVEEQRAFGLTVPDDAMDRKLEYIQQEILKTPEDIISATMGIMKLSTAGVSQASIEAAEASFRRRMAGTDIEQDQPAGGPVGVQPGVSSGGDSQGLGPDTVPISIAE